MRRSMLCSAVFLAVLTASVAQRPVLEAWAGPGSRAAARPAAGIAAKLATLPAGSSTPAAEVLRACAAIEVSASINPGSSDYIQQSIDRAHRDGMGCLIVKLNTPGGLLKATRQIVQKFLVAPLPVVVYVAPPGAHAGSAGAFITMAAHVAAMAPGTNIGAAHPIFMGGGKMDKESAKHLSRKAEEDATAFLRSIAKVRGRSIEWAEKVVRQSKALAHDEAVKFGVVDFVANDLADLLRKMDGRIVRVSGKSWKLRTAGAPVVWYDMTIKQRLINFFADPNLAYILMMIGMIGIIAELYHPGAIFPGVLGAICLILAFVSFQVLPIGTAGVLLLVLAVGLFIAEIYVTSFGILAAGGIAALVLGTVMFIDPGTGSDYSFAPGFGLSPWAVVPTAVLLGAFVLYASFYVVRARRYPVSTGTEGLVGEEGTALSEVGPGGGRVFAHGEYWAAESEENIPAGSRIEVVAVRGLKLRVRGGQGGT